MKGETLNKTSVSESDQIKATNWGKTIVITDHNKFTCYVNPYGNDRSGIPSNEDSEIAKRIVTAVNEYESLKDLTLSQTAMLEELQMEIDSQWEDIKTAPKDGSYILMADHTGEVHKAAWIINEDVTGKGNYDWCIADTYGDEQGHYYTVEFPTHWMPLPISPTKATQINQ